MNRFLSPPPALLASASLNRAIRDFVSKTGRAYRTAKANTFGFGERSTPFITSWFRTKSVNDAVDGEEFSQHLFGLAFDLTGQFSDLERFETELEKLGLKAFVNDDEDQIHIQYLTAGRIPESAFAIRDRILGE